MPLDLRFAEKLTALVACDRGGRGVPQLCRPQYFCDAVGLLENAHRVAVLSGFFVPDAGAPETDGPGGAVILARAFAEHGAEAEIWTDAFCLEAMQRCAHAAGFPAERVKIPAIETVLEEYKPDALLFTERLGRAADGRYYNMRMRDISEWTPPLDDLAYRCARAGIATVGIGDGGNEVGMGNFLDPLAAMLPAYRQCLSVVKTDAALPVDVSNWGAYALATALSAAWNEWRGHRSGDERAMLEALQACRVVDGISKQCDLSVDGFPLAEQEKIAASLHELWKIYKY